MSGVANSPELKGCALVTGAGGGLGEVIARRLAADGWPVVVNDIREKAARHVAESIVADGGRASGVAADATDLAEVERLVQRAASEFGPVLVTVANASGPQGEVTVDELSWDYLGRHLDFFAKSPLALVRAAAPAMREAGWGRIIHIGSDLFDRGDRGWSAYMAAKGAMLGLTRGWAMELGAHGITVNLVAPGWIPVERHGEIDESVERWWLGHQPIKRWGRPEDVAGAVSYLCSEDAAFVTGQKLVVNGGHHFG